MADPITLQPDMSQMNPQPTTPPAASGWQQYIPMASGGFGALGALFNLVQTIQRMKQMSDLRKYYRNWQQAANQKLSQLVGDAASRGLSGSPNALAGLVASSYAPFQAQAGQLQQSTIGATPGAINPFDQFLKAMDAMKTAFPSKPSDTGTNFNLNATRASTPSLDAGRFNMNPSGNPIFNVPTTDLGE
jgi:hypothetical protein